MNQQQALTILVRAANFAQSKGVFSLQDAAAVAAAVSTFTVQADSAETDEAEKTEEVKEEE